MKELERVQIKICTFPFCSLGLQCCFDYLLSIYSENEKFCKKKRWEKKIHGEQSKKAVNKAMVELGSYKVFNSQLAAAIFEKWSSESKNSDRFFSSFGAQLPPSCDTRAHQFCRPVSALPLIKSQAPNSEPASLPSKRCDSDPNAKNSKAFVEKKLSDAKTNLVLFLRG